MEINKKKVNVVDNVKLLGTHITSDLKWDQNTHELVRRANARMVLLRRLVQFNPKKEDMIIIYISYIKSILEQSCQVWHFSLTDENSNDLERVQKCALKIILGEKYISYESALEELNLIDLKTRRNQLCQKFAFKCTENERTKHYFKRNKKPMELRNKEKFHVEFAKTERYKKSSILQMQRLLNN